MDDDIKTIKGARDPNQGEGDRISSRRYDANAREFVAEGRVERAAAEAEVFVERDPDAAAKAEAEAKRGPAHHGVFDDIVAKGRDIVARVRSKLHK